MKRVITAALVAGLVVTSGCARGGGKAEAITRNDEVAATITTQMRGGFDATVKDRTVNTRIVLIRDENPEVQDLFGVQPVEPIEESGLRVLPGFLITPFTGKGKYTIEPGVPRDAIKEGAQPTASQVSSVRVEWWPPGGEPQEFVRRVKPCTVEVDDDDGTSGRLRCPELSHEAPGGATFSLDFRWQKK